MRRLQYADGVDERPIPTPAEDRSFTRPTASHSGMPDTHDRSKSGYVRYVKPVLDRVLAVFGLLVLLPVIALVAVVVYVHFGAPIIFGQRRMGRDGMVFTVYKFRSMHMDRRADRGDFNGPDRRMTHKSPLDPRLTPVGRLLRKLSLDELPQLVNVLKGDMSLVGPRPELPEVVDRYYDVWQHRRHVVKPGITGLWQISERGNGMMHEYVDIDLDYVDRVSFGTDMRILLMTIPAALVTNKGF